MMEENPNLTLEDIAKHCGVSAATVSRVINASKPVSKDLELRVRTAIRELGFEPKPVRERAKPPVVAFITQDILNPANPTILVGAQEAANTLGLGLIILNVNADAQQFNLKLLKQVNFDALILLHTSVTPADIFEIFPEFAMPMVVLGAMFESPRVHCINTDRETAMYQATKYLLSLGHTRLAYISGPPEWELSRVRLKGIQRALAEVDLTLDADFDRWSSPSIESGFQAVSSILNHPSGKRPTAILAFNDLVAIGAMHAIRTFGLTVPADISVVGFDNIYLAAHTNPPLTTIAQPKYQIGQLAIRKIQSSLGCNEPNPGGFTLLECPLVVRESTAPCKAES